MSQCSKSLSRLFWSLVEHIRVFSVGEGTVQTSSRHLGEKGCMLRSTFRVLIIGFSGLLYFLIFFVLFFMALMLPSGRMFCSRQVGKYLEGSFPTASNFEIWFPQFVPFINLPFFKVLSAATCPAEEASCSSILKLKIRLKDSLPIQFVLKNLRSLCLVSIFLYFHASFRDNPEMHKWPCCNVRTTDVGGCDCTRLYLVEQSLY